MSRRVGDEMPLSVAWLSAAGNARKFRLNGVTRSAGISFLHIIDVDRVYGKMTHEPVLGILRRLIGAARIGRLKRIRIDRIDRVG